MKKKHTTSSSILPILKMGELIFEESVFNEKKETNKINLIDERILTIYLNSNEVLTVMTVCDYPEYLAAGFLFNQNVIASHSQIKEIVFNEELDVVVVRTNEDTQYEIKQRNKIKTSGCAMGTVFGDMFDKLKPISKDNHNTFDISLIRTLIKEINLTPSLYLEAGAIHGTVLCCSQKILAYMEDVGRHNAVDKISGYILLANIDPSDKFLYTTGRLTSEMVLKTVSMRIPLLISRSGFTKSAVNLARQFNLAMIGRFRGKRFMCVSGQDRILFK